MKYQFITCLISDLIGWIENERIDLKPYYQRNDIWTKGDQQALIDTILKGYPLPSFFIYKKDHKLMEMVDGQQRARTIHRFCKGLILTSEKQTFTNIDTRKFYTYELSIG